MACKVGSGAAGGGAIGTGFLWSVCNEAVGPGTVHSWVTVEEITLSPGCGGAVPSVSPAVDGDAEALAIAVVDALAEGDCDAGWLLAEGCGAGVVHAVRTSASVTAPTADRATVR
jgi:hypothetical protein